MDFHVEYTKYFFNNDATKLMSIVLQIEKCLFDWSLKTNIIEENISII